MTPEQARDDYENDFRLWSDSYERRRRARIVMIFLPIVLALVLWVFSNTGLAIDSMSPVIRRFFDMLPIAMLALSGLAIVQTYLQTGFKSLPPEISFQQDRGARLLDELEFETQSTLLKAELQKAKEEMVAARAELERARSASEHLGDADRDALIEDLKAQIQSDAAKAILAEIKDDVAVAFKRETRERQILTLFSQSRERLSQELEELGRRGNVNLALGGVTTIVGLGLLGWAVFQEVTSESKDLWGMASHFVPRLTLVLMIELFAYFFLSLYKTSLQEIKYFQNELTNVEAKQIALRTAVEYGDQAMIMSMVSSLAATERNHVLSKDQTTVELEKAKIEREGRADFAKHFGEFFRKKGE